MSIATHDQPAGAWYPIVASAALAPAKILPVDLEGQSLVAWRAEDGALALWTDRCPHRGMRLSFGAIRGDALLCPYHGWTFGVDGPCRHIPAHPEAKPPHNARPEPHAIAEAQGYVWARLAAEDGPFAPPPALDGLVLTPARTLHLPLSAAAAAPFLAQLLPGLTAQEGMVMQGAIPSGEDGAVGYVAMAQPAKTDTVALHIAAIGSVVPADLSVLNAMAVRLRFEVLSAQSR